MKKINDKAVVDIKDIIFEKQKTLAEMKEVLDDVIKGYGKTHEVNIELKEKLEEVEKEIKNLRNEDKNLKAIKTLESKNQELEEQATISDDKKIKKLALEIKSLEAHSKSLQERNEKQRIEIEEKKKAKKSILTPKYLFDVITKNSIAIVSILMFSLAFSFLSDNDAMQSAYVFFQGEGGTGKDVSQTFIGGNKIYFQIVTSIFTIGAIFLLFLPREKLSNAREGLKNLEGFEFKRFLKKFKEVHNQIKLTESLESDYSRSLALRDITNTVKTEAEQISREEKANRIWIASSSLKNDIKDEILNNVLNKLETSAIEYVWIIPKDSNIAKEARLIIENRIKKIDDIKGKFKIIETGGDTSWMLTHDVVVYDFPEKTSVWESTFDSRYLELSNDNEGSIHFALQSIIDSAETSKRCEDNKEKNLIIFSNEDL